jgi:ribosomal-protein-alanine N-acetyltransferase
MSGDVILRPAGPAEAELLAALQQACFPDDPWSAESIATLAGQPGALTLLALRDGAPIGFVLARVAGEDGEIIVIGVLPQARRGGVGARLVTGALEGVQRLGATALFLEVAEDNGAARALYNRCGFLPVGRRPGYYKRPDGRIAALVLRFSFECK